MEDFMLKESLNKETWTDLEWLLSVRVSMAEVQQRQDEHQQHDANIETDVVDERRYSAGQQHVQCPQELKQ